MAVKTHTVQVDRDTGRLDARNLRDLLSDVEDYLHADRVDMDDEAAIVACNLLVRHFDGENTSEADWKEPQGDNS
jgi:hypothetical protein